MPPLPESDRCVHIAMPAEVVRRVDVVAKQTGETRSGFIRRLFLERFNGSGRA